MKINLAQAFSDQTIVVGTPVESAPINLESMQPDGNFSEQFDKDAGTGLLKLSYKLSLNGSSYLYPDGEADYIVEEEDAAEEGLTTFRPALATSMILVAEATVADIENLNVWVAVQ